MIAPWCSEDTIHKSGLERQRVFNLVVNGVSICKYQCDFWYLDANGREVVEDVKGVRTRDYVIKAKLMLAVHAVRVVEIQ